MPIFFWALYLSHISLSPLRKGGNNSSLGGRECVCVFIDETRACLLVVGGKEASEEGDTVHCLVMSTAPVHLATQA